MATNQPIDCFYFWDKNQEILKRAFEYSVSHYCKNINLIPIISEH